MRLYTQKKVDAFKHEAKPTFCSIEFISATRKCNLDFCHSLTNNGILITFLRSDKS